MTISSPSLQWSAAVVAALFGLVASVRPDEEMTQHEDQKVNQAFEAFIQEHGRTYRAGGEEHHLRRQAFEESFARVRRQNERPEAERLWTAGIGAFADRTPAELQALNGWRHHPGSAEVNAASQASALLERSSDVSLVGESQDWTHLWASQAAQVREQTCGNCWAAATASMMESHLELHRGLRQRYNMAVLTYCTPNPYSCGGTGGCGGATSELAMQYVLDAGWATGEEEELDHCPQALSEAKISDFRNDKASSHEWRPGFRAAAPDAAITEFGVVGWERLPQNRYFPVLEALYLRGPVAVAVAVSWTRGTFALYRSGIYDDCQDLTLGHAMLAVGYGVENGIKYWKLQNSWGPGFGENGMMRLIRHDDEESQCGTDTNPSEGTTCKQGGPDSVEVCGSCGILYDSVVPHFLPTTAEGRELAQKRGEAAPAP